jgi:hypothetical protein
VGQQRVAELVRDLLLAIEGPAVDEHPYEACHAEVPGTP